MPLSRAVFIRSKDSRLPYSKGVMTQTLTAAGLTPERGHAIASLVERRLTTSHGGRGEELTVGELHEYVESVLREEEGDEAAVRFRRWTILKHKDVPIIMTIGGTAGSGKSTVAQLVAARLGITRVTSTDMVRQVMRAFFSPALMPVLHHSSFDVPVSGIELPGDLGNELGMLGYLEQARQVCVGVNAVLDRSERERVSTLIEGVHLVPGLVQPVDMTRSAVIDVVVHIEDEQTHRAHFTMRGLQTDGTRPVDHYLQHFAHIRSIQDYLVEQADRRGVPVLENMFLDDTVRQLVDHTLDVVERVVAERDRAAGLPTATGPLPMGLDMAQDAADVLGLVPTMDFDSLESLDSFQARESH
ncbi:MAG: 2-phosphoglycerate kinase [Thermoleophilia bacterium]|nr:2-phosphoglycerate kinase [Thermoleophilia bacterium]